MNNTTTKTVRTVSHSFFPYVRDLRALVVSRGGDATLITYSDSLKAFTFSYSAAPVTTPAGQRGW